ncbi:hypothetical protein [Bordetella genomosp. 11]|uniref:hypothetical protein n=1 Tax=Bordetella genomosp. 11 TaxID=1416808 RepID=UPI0011400542|nr:hypothetical protein [Bordetella genomosp. 11]
MTLAPLQILCPRGIAMSVAPNTLNPRTPSSSNIAEELTEHMDDAPHREPAPGEPPLPHEPPTPGDPPDSPPAPEAKTLPLA